MGRNSRTSIIDQNYGVGAKTSTLFFIIGGNNMRQNKIRAVGAFCRNFRIVELNKTLEDMGEETNLKTLSGFEHGRSSNILHVFTYINACESQTQRSVFLQGLFILMEGIDNEWRAE